ncbi:hypothetical protein LAWI1_G008296 [Lachnellula willkommii]|uniref:Protein kinase domain-containing protein n=1 Tax=Lachnellula willkommii TaxID=215461 RepID=A0A559M283_9HELO|nr:hypothetical protein LAWI1_G008296 [Lachnellula willkommii]
MSHIEVIEVHRYYPDSVKRIIGRGGDSYIGMIDETTVLKYPCIPNMTSNLRLENQFLKILGSHPRIIGSKGLTDDGLRLEYAVNGDLHAYITANPATSLQQRLRWFHGDYADVKTDLFALGSAIYFIMMGHEIFPDLDSNTDDEEIERRFRDGEFPVDSQLCDAVTRKCWAQEYDSAQEVLNDITAL